MTLQQIRYCLTIAETGSMNRAAENLYVTQPALTGAVQELETELGITIFNRTNRGVTLTNEGRRFLHYARQIYQQYELMEQEYLRPKKRVFGVSTQHYSFVTKAFVDTARQFDVSRFEYAIRETRTIDVIHDVAQGRSAIGVLFRSRHNRTVLNKMLSEAKLEFHPLIECNAYVYLWKGHPLAKNESISMEELCGYPCLCFEQGGPELLLFCRGDPFRAGIPPDDPGHRPGHHAEPDGGTQRLYPVLRHHLPGAERHRLSGGALPGGPGQPERQNGNRLHYPKKHPAG